MGMNINLNWMINKKHYDRTFKVLGIIGAVATLFNIVCRMSTAVADFYSLQIYPAVSGVLSYISNAIPLPLQEISIALMLMVAVALSAMAITRKWGWWRWIKYEGAILLLMYGWFYMAWCNNYSRSTIFQRTGIEKKEYNERKFKAFIRSFAKNINSEWTADTISNYRDWEEEMKAFYANVPEVYGLAKPKEWHHAKEMTFGGFYSAVGVKGFMAPLYAESFLNPDNQAFDSPSVYAHEYSHLLGVSSEAEANWWAYKACTASQIQAVRYSGYKGILPNVMVNARRFLTEKEYEAWMATLRPEVINDLESTRDHWTALRSPAIDGVQSFVYDAFLKSNSVESGMNNYSEVVAYIMTLEE